MELRDIFCYTPLMFSRFKLLVGLSWGVLFLHCPAFAGPLAEDFAAIHSQATELAGEPNDITQRVKVLLEIFEDSKRNDPFPGVALHGALWARSFLPTHFELSALAVLLHPLHPARAIPQYTELDQFETAFEAANRQVFIDTYTNYHFSKLHGKDTGADAFIRPELLAALNKVHQAVETGTLLTQDERREVFHTCLINEQEISVGPAVSAAVAHFSNPWLLSIAMKPRVKFKYFPEGVTFKFHNFSSVDERVKYATDAYELAETVGWDNVVDSIDDYRDRNLDN